MRSGGIDGVHLDGIELILEEDSLKLAALELCSAHPLRNDRNAEAGLEAGHDTIGGSDLNSALDID
jgi:hypothetical protein